MSRTREKSVRACKSIRFLRVESSPLEGLELWDTYSVVCPRRGRVGLEVCLECRLSGRIIVDPHGVPVRLGCGLGSDDNRGASTARPQSHFT
jgi:hypothetical protein